MKYCQECGKQLFDEDVYCPGCGCRTAGSQPTHALCSYDYPKIREFTEDVKRFHACSIASVILSFFGIGFIIVFALCCELKEFSIPKFSTTHPFEIAELETAKKKMRKCLDWIDLSIVFGGMVPLIVSIFMVENSRDRIGLPDPDIERMATCIAIITLIISGLLFLWKIYCVKNLRKTHREPKAPKTSA